MFDPVTKKTSVSRDVYFNENSRYAPDAKDSQVSYNWPEMGEAEEHL